MKNKVVTIIDKIRYEHLEFCAFVVLILWAINPFIELIFKKYLRILYTKYFSIAIYIIGILGFALYSVYLIKKIRDKKITLKKSIPYLLILALWILSIIATILAQNPYLSLFGESYRKEGLIVYTLYIGFVLLASMLNDKKYINYLFTIIIISGLFITIMPLFNYFFTYAYFSNIYLNTNHYGYFLMIATILAGLKFLSEEKWVKYFYIASYIVLLYMLIMNDTFGSYLALVVTFAVALIYTIAKKYKIFKMALLFVLIFLLSFMISHYHIAIGVRNKASVDTKIVENNMTSFKHDLLIILSGKKDALKTIGSYRGILWYGAINCSLDNPLFGLGFEGLNECYLKQEIGINDRPHNILLQVSTSIGIPGAIIYLFLICYLALVDLKRLDKDGTYITIYFTSMCYFISSQFGNTMYYTSPYFAILVGLGIGIYVHNFEIKKKKKLKTHS